MKQKNEKLANLAWISRFWALYSKLPETYKKGFSSLVINISKEIEKKGKKRVTDIGEFIECSS